MLEKVSFEGIKDNKNDKKKKERKPQNDATFELLKSNNDDLVKKAENIQKKIQKIIDDNVEDIENNITFDIIFASMDLSLNEYNQLSNTFNSYAQIYNDIFNEENAVQILNILRQILSDRRTLINDLINNLLKVQRLSNDKLKLNIILNDDSDDDVSDLLTPNSL